LSLALGGINYVFGAFSLIIFFLFSKLIVEEGFTIGGTEKPSVMTFEVAKSSLQILLGIAIVIVSANVATNSSIVLAKALGVAESLIGATIISLGTTLPEMSVSLAALKKRDIELAVGNIVGSLVANFAFILGISAMIAPVNFDSVVTNGIFFMILANIMFLGLLRRQVFTRSVGSLLIAAYIIFLIVIAM
jgi:cation:H+ antiporter